MADDMEDVALQVERDAVSMFYTLPGPRHQLAHVIFDIALNRPEHWAKNGGMFCVDVPLSSHQRS
jgi:hypothetical protein